MKNLLLLLSLICALPLSAARHNKEKIAIVEYSSESQSSEYGSKTMLYYNNGVAKIYQVPNEGVELIPQAAKETSYINFLDSTYVKKATLKNQESIHNTTPITKLYDFELTNEYKKILGYKCRKATKVSFSNRIDVWFTTDAKVKGTPLPHYGLTDGLIMSIYRNGSNVLTAKDIKFIRKRKAETINLSHLGKEVDNNNYRFLIRENYVTRVTVFDEAQVAWWNKSDDYSEGKLNKVYHVNGGTVVLKKIKLPKVTPDHQVFVKVTQYSNGDAYDRTGTVFLLPTDKEVSPLDAFAKETINKLPSLVDNKGNEIKGVVSTDNFDCAIELMRFFTPFGVRKYNDRVKIPGQEWRNQAVYKQDITHLLPKLEGEVWIGATVGNYDKGGHKLTVEISYYPTEMVKREKYTRRFVQPIFNNVIATSKDGNTDFLTYDSLKVNFNVPKNVKNLQMMYITTGHGGWGGGDEFNQKENTILVDGQHLFNFIPWRTDCATYRELNPASGNFWNGISSSDYSRSNWAPGTTTNPIVVPMGNVKPGNHTMSITIPQGPKGCAWNLSGVLIGEYIDE